MERRTVLAAISGLVIAALSSPSQPAGPTIMVFKTRTCSCCGKWVEHLKSNGFVVKVQEVSDTSPYQRQYHVPRTMQSCHTAVVNGYTIEGSRPCRRDQTSAERAPEARRVGGSWHAACSPGMESSRNEPYSVMSFDERGRVSVYSRYPR